METGKAVRMANLLQTALRWALSLAESMGVRMDARTGLGFRLAVTLASPRRKDARRAGRWAY